MLAVLRNGPMPAVTAVLVIVVTVLYHAGGSYFNDLNDTETDAASTEAVRHGRTLLTGRALRGDLVAAGLVCTVGSLLLSLLLPWPVILVMLGVLLLGLGYNFRPVHFAGRPLLAQLFWIVMWATMFVICGVALQTDQWIRGLPFAIFVCLFMGLGEGITQDIRDADNDARGGRVTTPVAFGTRVSVALAWVAQLASLAPWLWFALTFPLPAAATVIGTGALVVWLVVFLRLALRLRDGFDKGAARLTHVGAIYAFTAVNLTTAAGALFVPLPT